MFGNELDFILYLKETGGNIFLIKYKHGEEELWYVYGVYYRIIYDNYSGQDYTKEIPPIMLKDIPEDLEVDIISVDVIM